MYRGIDDICVCVCESKLDITEKKPNVWMIFGFGSGYILHTCCMHAVDAVFGVRTIVFHVLRSANMICVCVCASVCAWEDDLIVSPAAASASWPVTTATTAINKPLDTIHFEIDYLNTTYYLDRLLEVNNETASIDVFRKKHSIYAASPIYERMEILISILWNWFNLKPATHTENTS